MLQFINALYMLDDMDTHMWMLVRNEADGASARVLHYAEYHREAYDEEFYEYVLNESKWCKVATTGYRPLGRGGAAAGHYGQHSVLYFGGYDHLCNVHYGDLFIYNSQTSHVTLVKAYGCCPTPQKIISQCLLGTEFIICGGTSHRSDEKTKRISVVQGKDEMYILSLLPILQHLCMMVVKETQLDTYILPKHIREWLKEF